jgi:hypothetical protein
MECSNTESDCNGRMFLLKRRCTYHTRFIPEGEVEASQIFLQDPRILPKLLSYEEN